MSIRITDIYIIYHFLVLIRDSKHNKKKRILDKYRKQLLSISKDMRPEEVVNTIIPAYRA